MPQRLGRITSPTTHATMVVNWPHQRDPTDAEIESMLSERRSTGTFPGEVPPTLPGGQPLPPIPRGLQAIEEAGRVDIPWYQRAAAAVPEPIMRGLQAFDWHPVEAAREIGRGAKQVVTGTGEEEEPRTAGFRKVGRGAFGVIGPPAMAAGSVVAPIPTAAFIGAGVGASYLRPYAERGLEELGALPELAGAGLDVAELATALKAGKGGARVQSALPKAAPTWLRGGYRPPPEYTPIPARVVPAPAARFPRPPPTAPGPVAPVGGVPPAAQPDLQAEIARVTDAVADAAKRGDHAAILALRPQVVALQARVKAMQQPAQPEAAPVLPPVPPPAAPLQDARAFEARQFTRNVQGRPTPPDSAGQQQLRRNVREAMGEVSPPEGFELNLEEAVPGAREAELMQQLERNVREAQGEVRPVEAGELELEPSPEIAQFVQDFKRSLAQRLAAARPEPVPTTRPMLPEEVAEFGAPGRGTTTALPPPIERGEVGLRRDRSSIERQGFSIADWEKATGKNAAGEPVPAAPELGRPGLVQEPVAPDLPAGPPQPTVPSPWELMESREANPVEILDRKAQETFDKSYRELSDAERDQLLTEQRLAPERAGAQVLIDEMRTRGIDYTDLLTELRNRMKEQAERAAAFEGGAAERLRAPMERQALPAVEAPIRPEVITPPKGVARTEEARQKLTGLARSSTQAEWDAMFPPKPSSDVEQFAEGGRTVEPWEIRNITPTRRPQLPPVEPFVPKTEPIPLEAGVIRLQNREIPPVEPPTPTAQPTELPRVASPQEVRWQQDYDSALTRVKANPTSLGVSDDINLVVSNGRALGMKPEEVGVDLQEAGVPTGIMVPRVRRGYGMEEAAPEPEQVVAEKTGFGAALRKQRTRTIPMRSRFEPGAVRRDVPPFEPAPPSTARMAEPTAEEAGVVEGLRKLWHDEQGQLDLKELAKGLQRFRDSLVNVGRLEVTSGREHLRKFGPAGIQADKEINDFFELRHRIHGDLQRSYWRRMNKVGAHADDTTWQQTVARLDPQVAEAKGIVIEPNPTADKLATAERTVLDRLHEVAREHGVRGVGAEELGYTEEYFPWMYPEEIWGDRVSAFTQEQVGPGKKFRNVAEAEEWVNNVIRSRGERIAPNIQLPRTRENATLVRTDRAVLPEYYKQWADKIAEARVLGPKGKGSALPARILEYASQVYEQTHSRAKMNQFLDLVGKGLTPEPLSPMKAEVWQHVRSGVVAMKMGLSFLPNMAQSSFQYILTGMKPYLAGIARIAQEYRAQGKDFVGDAAVTADQFLQELKYREGVEKHGAGEWVTERLTPFAWEERMVNRPTAYSGEIWLEKLYARLKADPNDAFARRQLSKHLEIDPDELLSEGLTEEMKRHATFSMAQKTQFGYNPLELPGGWGTTLTSRMRHMFMNFAFGATKFVKDAVIGELRHGNPMPLIRLLIVGQVLGEPLADLQAIIRNKERPDNLALRALDNMMSVGAFGVAASIFTAMGISGGLAALAIGAPVSIAAGYAQSAWPTSKPGSLIRRAIGDIPVVGRPISGYLFPRKKPTGRVPPPFPRQQSRPRGAPSPF